MSKIKHTSDGGSTDYYNIPPDANEIQDLVEYRNMNFAMGNIFKACWRIGQKEGIDDIYDLNKIIFFAEREKDRLSKLNDVIKVSNDIPVSPFLTNTPTWIYYNPALDDYPWRENSKIDYHLTKVRVRYVNGKTARGRFKDFGWSPKSNGYEIIEYQLL